MKPDAIRLLAKCRDLEDAHAATPRPPDWQWYATAPYDEQTAHGPAYAPSAWFGPMSNADRQALLRALHGLVAGGYIETWARCGDRFTNIKLTDLGRAHLAEREAANAS